MRPLTRLAFLLGLSLTLGAADFAALKPEGYLSDFARVVNPQQKQAIEAYCKSVEDATGVQIALVTLPSLEREPIEDVANLLFRKWGIGQKGKDNGILLLLALGERRSRVEVGYGLEPIIPDGYAGSVLREMRPALAQGDYGTALTLAAESIGTRVAQAMNKQLAPAGPLRQSRRPAREPDIPWLPILFMVVAGLALLSKIGRGGPPRGPRMRGGGGDVLTGMLLGNMLGGGWGGHRSSGGGFGGYDGGGGFGGFGGGDSGGGGASSDW